MTNMLYLSRSFVEIGPFSAEELSSFFVRGVLKDTDYVRAESADEWLHVNDWVASLTPAAPVAEAPAPAAAAKKAPAKKAAAKTAAKKAPAKKAAKKSA
ncbi:hypothetical protein SAMN02745166_04492 [Prosthecobacter debontii]|uniref:GYF domain-containing protein n=1 Tax=Prosthecobacter debontii TaxID=48467 RepID=A0A1T4YXG2_9BACT|nr:GYF domain-containing protein [Prosthecobacter debontii]SKB06472.1 hypothetical protein SAMN02745166_04492 [Prosthecobacter debontii]